MLLHGKEQLAHYSTFLILCPTPPLDVNCSSVYKPKKHAVECMPAKCLLEKGKVQSVEMARPD